MTELVAHPLWSRLVDCGAANSFPLSSSADTFVCSDKKQRTRGGLKCFTCSVLVVCFSVLFKKVSRCSDQHEIIQANIESILWVF